MLVKTKKVAEHSRFSTTSLDQLDYLMRWHLMIDTGELPSWQPLEEHLMSQMTNPSNLLIRKKRPFSDFFFCSPLSVEIDSVES